MLQWLSACVLQGHVWEAWGPQLPTRVPGLCFIEFMTGGMWTLGRAVKTTKLLMKKMSPVACKVESPSIVNLARANLAAFAEPNSIPKQSKIHVDAGNDAVLAGQGLGVETLNPQELFWS